MEKFSQLKFGEVTNVLKELNQNRNNEKAQGLKSKRYEMLDIKTFWGVRVLRIYDFSSNTTNIVKIII